jgi:hypothetical protein
MVRANMSKMKARKLMKEREKVNDFFLEMEKKSENGTVY